jgi:hypothetical protein
MKKIHIFGAAFFAVLAFGVVSAANSVAAPKWLLNGAAITSPQHALTEGKWLLLGLANPEGKTITHIACSGVLLGTVGPGATDEVTKVYGLGGVTETNINCEVLHGELGSCTGALLALIEAENLPWKTELLLVAGTMELVDHFTAGPNGEPAFLLRCTGPFGVAVRALCLALSILTDALQNRTTGVFGQILNALSFSCPLQDPVNVGLVSHIYAEGLTKTLTGTLSVSD